MRRARVPGTFSKITVTPLGDGEPVEVTTIQSAAKPDCRDCKHAKHVVRYMGRWICAKHLMVKNTKIKTGPMGEPVVIGLPHGVDMPFNMRPEWSFGELFVNRAHRRQAGHTRAFA